MNKLLIPLILLISSNAFALNVFKNNPRTNKDDIVFATEISSTVIGLSNFASKELLRVSTTAISGGSGITKAQGDTYYLGIGSGSSVVPYTVLGDTLALTRSYIDTKLDASSGSLVVPYTVLGDTMAANRLYGDMTYSNRTATNTASDFDCRASTGVMQTEIDALFHGNLDLYLTNKKSLSGEYFLMTTTPSSNIESTITKSITGSNIIIASFTTNSPLNITYLKEGTYAMHMHASVDSVVKTTRMYYSVYGGTGTTEVFLMSSELSNIITSAKSSYEFHISTNIINTPYSYLSMRLYASATGTGANPTITVYMEGSDSAKFELPITLVDVSVTKINAGNNISISPTSGLGDVTITANAYNSSTVWYSTSSIYAEFTDTTTVNLVGLESIKRIPFDAVLKSWVLDADTTGSATVAISTGEVTGSGLTFGTVFITATLSTQQTATGTASGQTIPRGYRVKFVVLTNTTSKELYPSLDVWRRQ